VFLLIHRAESVVYRKQEIRQEVTEMEKSPSEALNPRQQNLEEDISFDESVCSAEFSEGCTLPISEQPDQP
jgi:hypothetical protein